MKSIYVTLLTILVATSLMAGNKTARSTNDWNNNDTWNPNAVPGNGDSIIIPAGFTVTVDGNFDLDNVVIIVRGVLDLDNGKLRLNANSRVIIETGGRLTGQGHNDQLRIGTEEKFNGSEPDQLGYSYADNSTGGGFLSGVVLPVNFQSFYVARQGSNVQLSWSTSAELNNQQFAVERSADARNWKQVAVVAGAGTSNLVNKYSYTDKNITDVALYYRIRQVDMSGTAFYSAIRSLRNSEGSQVANIYASNKTITVDFNSDVKDKVSIQLINLSGQVVVRKEFYQASYRLIVDAMSAGSGVYVVRVSDTKGWSEVKKIAL